MWIVVSLLFEGLNLNHSSKDTNIVDNDPFNAKCTSINISLLFNSITKIRFQRFKFNKKKSFKHQLVKICKLFHRIFEIFSEEFKVKIAVLISMFVCFCKFIYPDFYSKSLNMYHSNALLTILIKPILKSF